MSTLAATERSTALDAAILALVEARRGERAGSLAVVERTGRQGEMTPLHAHPEDELVYVVEGLLTVFVGSAAVRLHPGDAFAAPRAIPHALRVESRNARYVSASVVRSVARYEDFLRAVAVPVDEPASSWEESGDASRLAAFAAPNGIHVLGAPGDVDGNRWQR
jgi:quercetin dioxygenase-like cupin family protein